MREEVQNKKCGRHEDREKQKKRGQQRRKEILKIKAQYYEYNSPDTTQSVW